jgi:hypothetical protein
VPVGAQSALRGGSVGVRMAQTSLSRELWFFLRARKKFWLLPILLVLALVGSLLVFAQGSALAPFIYTIF